ncbi:MAG: hypothetical protein MUE83_01210 [Tabrizicola sp.]|nr:hypothetical protein [Tabrizicola sp.]
MADVLITVLVYEGMVALVYILCWRLVRGVDTRLPIAGSLPGESGARTGRLPAEAAPRQAPVLLWQILAFLIGAGMLAAVAVGVIGLLAGLRDDLVAAAASPVADAALLRLALPLGHLALLLVLYLLLRRSVLFPTIAVHLFLLLFCLLVTMLDPGRLQPVRLTLTPVFVTNLVLLIVTHGLLTLLFCRTRTELLGAVFLAVVAGGILALGTLMIALVSTLFGGPLFFFQLYLISALGIFGLYFCASSILLARWARD